MKETTTDDNKTIKIQQLLQPHMMTLDMKSPQQMKEDGKLTILNGENLSEIWIILSYFLLTAETLWKNYLPSYKGK